MSEKENNSQTKKPKTSLLGILKLLVIVVGVSYVVLMLLMPGTPLPGRKCRENIISLGNAMIQYANDYDEYTVADRWCDLLIEHGDVTEKWFVCPSAGNGRCHYAINPRCGPNSPEDMVLLFEIKGGWNQSGGQELLTFENHNGNGCHVLFNDRHVEFVRPDQIGELKWKKVEEGNSVE